MKPFNRYYHTTFYGECKRSYSLKNDRFSAKIRGFTECAFKNQQSHINKSHNMPDNDTSLNLLEWQSLDSHPHERSSRWYMTGGICVLAFAAYGLFDGSWSTALLALLIGGIYFLLRNSKPNVLTIRITQMGIHRGNDFLQWSMLSDFWILVGETSTELHIIQRKMLEPEVVIFINDINPADVRETLLQFLPERAGMQERPLDTLGKILKL
jgi:hypothetical protein